MRAIVVAVSLLVCSLAADVTAETIDGRLGMFGKAGVAVPLKDDFIGDTSKTKTAFITGGGFIYGITDTIAAELNVLHAPSLNVETSGVKTFKGSLTDVSIGLQYRLLPQRPLVPYLGLGADLIVGDLEHVINGNRYDLEWTPGGYVSAGVDFFITRGIALVAEARGVFTSKGDIKRGDAKVGEYDPMNFQATVGVRLLLPERF